MVYKKIKHIIETLEMLESYLKTYHDDSEMKYYFLLLTSILIAELDEIRINATELINS